MGRASKHETIASIYQAFLGQRTWRQSDLARELGIGTRALRERLVELSTKGMPLESDEEPPHVFWSVPQHWFPGGVALTSDDAAHLLRELWVLPKSPRTERAIKKLLSGVQDREQLASAAATVVPVVVGAEAVQREIVEEALIAGAALRIEYFSAHRGVIEWRYVSPARLVAGPPLRLVALCHRSSKLRWFRVDGILRATLDQSEPYRATDPEVTTRFIAESVNGYRDEAAATDQLFFVRLPEARWVSKNLPPSMVCESVEDGIVVTARAGGVLPVARFVVGLGAAASPRTSPLREIVRELAEGALTASAPARSRSEKTTLNKGRARSIRSGR
jgi:predicted DNA-binding transcriptional regulator YafY